jgi:hypothetical protein
MPEHKITICLSPVLEQAIKVFCDALLSFEPEEFGSTGSKSQPSSVEPTQAPAVTEAKTEAPAKRAAPSLEDLKAKILEMPGGKALASKVIKEMGLQKITDLKTDDQVLDFVARLGVA